MPVVHVDTIAAKHEAKLVNQADPNSLNTKDLKDLLNIIRSGLLVVNLIAEPKNLLKSDTVCLN